MTGSITNVELARRLDEIRDMTLENQRAIKGTNGSLGIATRLEVLERQINTELKYIGSKISEIAEKQCKEEDARKEDARLAAHPTPSQPLVKEEKLDQANAIKWKDLIVYFFGPVTTAVLIYILTHYIFIPVP